MNKYTIFEELNNSSIVSLFTKNNFDFNLKTNTVQNIQNN